MPSDQEYLAQAGLDAETGLAVKAQDTASEQTQQQADAQQKAVEMFEVSGAKYPVDTKFKIPHSGKVLEVPYSTLANTYRQFQHMQDKWTSEFKPKIDEFQKLKPEFDKYKGFYDKYGQLQTWSEQNPKEWETLWNLYQNKDKHLLDAQVQGQQQAQQAPGQNPNLQPITEHLSKLQQELEGLRNFKTQFEQEQTKKQEQADTDAVLTEVKQFKEQYPELNLDERDPDGVTLWGKVIKYGIEQGLPTFKASANVFLEERLRDIWASRARTDAVKSFQADNKAGVIKRSTTPMRGQGAKPDIKNLSYAQLTEMAKNGSFQEASGV